MNIEIIKKRIKALIIDTIFVQITSRVLLIIMLHIIFNDGNIPYPFSTLPFYIMLSLMLPPQFIPIYVTQLLLVNDDDFYVVGFLLIYLIVSEIIYYLIRQINFEQTLGEKRMKITVKRYDGGKLTFFKALLRAILKSISNYLFCIPYIILFFTKNQTLHDKASGSLVVEHNE